MSIQPANSIKSSFYRKDELTDYDFPRVYFYLYFYNFYTFVFYTERTILLKYLKFY